MTVLIKADPASQHKACAGDGATILQRHCAAKAPRDRFRHVSCAPQTGPTSRLGNIKQVQLARSVLEKF
jgi:hypothetical protein